MIRKCAAENFFSRPAACTMSAGTSLLSIPDKQTGGSFYLRLVIGILCFICFVYMDQSNAGVAEVNSTSIVNQIEKDLDMDTVMEVWNNL